jgi:hypothetical protein
MAVTSMTACGKPSFFLGGFHASVHGFHAASGDRALPVLLKIRKSLRRNPYLQRRLKLIIDL